MQNAQKQNINELKIKPLNYINPKESNLIITRSIPLQN